jgi:DNA-binding CsgD family transcriptional regulator
MAVEAASGAVVVAGDAGVGKSRLVAELERRARADGKLVLIGECLDVTEGELPYAPIVAALRPVLRQAEVLESLTAPERAELARLWPELGQADGVTAGESSQARLFALLLGLLTRLGSEQPVLFIVEDLHWADRSTRDFLAFLVRAARGAELLLVATLRAEDLPREHPLREFVTELTRVRGVQRLELAPFTRDEVALQVEEILGEKPSPELVATLFERSEGNAFYTEELLAAGDGTELPASLRDALLVRIERLSEPARRLLALAATAGRAVDEGLLEAVGEVPKVEFVPALREALAQQVLVPRGDGSSYAFRHALVREAVYRDLLAGERAQLHAALARTLVSRPELALGGIGVAGELAHHWHAAGELGPAFEASVQASADAERAFAFAETQRHAERALMLWDRLPDPVAPAGLDRPALLGRAAGAAIRADNPGRAVELARQAVEELDPKRDAARLARAHVLVGRGLWLSGDNRGALEAYRAAVRLVPPEPATPERALVVAGEAQALMLTGRFTEARARCEEALELACAADDRLVQAHVHNTLAGLGWLGGDPIEHAAIARQIAFDICAVEEIGRSYANGSEALEAAGRTEEAIRLAEEGIALAPEWGLHDFVVYLTSSIAMWQLRLGRFEEVERLLTEITPRGHTAAAPRHEALGRMAMARGEFSVAEAELARAEELSRGLGGPEWWPSTLAGIGLLRLLQGRLEEAADYVQRALDGLDDTEYAPWLNDFADVYPTAARIHADRAEHARARGGATAEAEAGAGDAVVRLDAMLSLLPEDHRSPRFGACRTLAAAEATRAAGRSDPVAWKLAADEFLAVGARYSQAYAQFRQAEALLAAAGDGRAAAAPPLQESHSTTVELGERPLRAEIETLAQRARVVLGEEPEDPGSELGITAREHEVLALLAEGRTNREIAETLVITEKTASVHVSHILAKLDARNRGEAAAIAHRLGLTVRQ